jgi:multidrug efflux pump subunit AcrA (membrane-fusion protein)
VPGYLTPTAGAAKIFATTPGVVTEVYVREGDQVQGGQPLLTIGTGQIAADGQDVNAAMLTALALQRGLLRQQIAAQEQRTEAERDRLSALIRSQASEVAQIEAQIAAQGDGLLRQQIAAQEAQQEAQIVRRFTLLDFQTTHGTGGRTAADAHRDNSDSRLIIEHDKVEAGPMLGEPALAATAGLALQSVDEIDNGVKAAPCTAADAGSRDSYREMRRASAGAADQHSIALPH